MFGNTYANQYQGPNSKPVTGFALNKFCHYDLKPLGVSPDARFANIGGILIITGNAEIQISFRGTADPATYQQQLLSTEPNGGQRSVVYDTVPLVNGCFEAKVVARQYPDIGSFPTGVVPAVGWNFKLKAWGR